ncbi:MAG: hypothetical protein Q4G13_05470 [Moraxella sp.]|nr:hypothetical protein [Moraxella sp.]
MATPSQSTFHRLTAASDISTHLCCAALGICLLSATASHAAYADSMTYTTPMDLSNITADPYELALTQVLAEICPPLLSPSQKQLFTQAYNAQMQYFLPNLDTTAALRQISNQRDYRGILKSVRSWTLSYPTNENKALCIEFAQSSEI